MNDRLTAMDVEKQEFASRVRGYDREEVRMFLRSVAEDEIKAWFCESQAAAPIPSETSGSGKTPLPSRAALLERVRARTTSYGSMPSPDPATP